MISRDKIKALVDAFETRHMYPDGYAMDRIAKALVDCLEDVAAPPQAEAQSNECQHKNGTAHWDYYGCNDCGWIMPSGPNRGGPHNGWFPSLDAVREFDKFKTYPGMSEVKPMSMLSPQSASEGDAE
jgi:hypothetical protein